MDPHIRAQELIPCDLCKTESVEVHCDTCYVELCNACTGKHMASDESKKKHEIIKYKFRKSFPLYPKCSFHDKQQCEMYCKQCDIPICITCIVSEEHSGHKIFKILQILDERKEKIIKEQKELADTILPTYLDIASDVEKSIEQLEKEYGDLSSSIGNQEKEWHRKVAQTFEQLQTELKELKTKQILTLQKHLIGIQEKVSEISNEIKSPNIDIDSNDISEQLSITLNVDKYRNLPPKPVPSLPIFTPGTAQGEEVFRLFGTLSLGDFTLNEHGYSIMATQISPEAGSSPSDEGLFDDPEIISTINTDYGSYLNAVACLNEDEIWTRGNEKTMKLFSISQGSLLMSIETNSGCIPEDIAVTKRGNLVYTDPGDRTVNIVKNRKKKTLPSVLSLKDWVPGNICTTHSGDLLVVLNSNDKKQTKIVRYSGFTEKQTIQFDDEGKLLYSYGYTKYLCENKNLDICVADNNAKAVVVVNPAGKLRFRYNGYKSALGSNAFKPMGITTDSKGRILAADSVNNCVHIIDQNGQFLRFLDCGLHEPWGLCTDTNDHLLVAEFASKHVKKIKYQQ